MKTKLIKTDIKKFLDDNLITVQDLANQTGLHPNSIYNIYSMKDGYTSVFTINKIRNIYPEFNNYICK